MDLVFEGDRLYLHNTEGYFGAVPLRLTGDLDLDPETGEGVEMRRKRGRGCCAAGRLQA
jgi:hypothetical protein